MAHEIYFDGDRASMMYVGELPWHGLGTRLDRPATAAQAIKAANLDWEVTKLPLFGTNGQHAIPVKDKFVTVRADKVGKPDAVAFGIVGKDYTPLQNSDAFVFFDKIVRDSKAAIYHTAGALGKGERIWILAKLPGEILVAGTDVTHKYLLLSNNHDGRAGVRIKFTPTRVVCNNTLTIALRAGQTISVSHLRDLETRLDAVPDLLGIITEAYAEIETRFNEFARVRMNTERLRSYLKNVFPDPQESHKPDSLRKVETNRRRAEHLFANGVGNDRSPVAGTLWAAYNGVTEMVDHVVRTTGFQPNGNSRHFNSVLFGQGSNVKARAFQAAADSLESWRN